MVWLRKPDGAEPPTQGAFTNNRRVWDEWIGAAAVREKRAYWFAGGALALAAAAMFGYYDATVRRPFSVIIVERDVNMRVIATDTGRGTKALTNDQVDRRFRNWIYSARAVVVDAQAMRVNIDDAYASVKSGSAASVGLMSYHQANDPMEQAAKNTVHIYRQTALNQGGNTWQVDWCESRTSRDGIPISVQAWRMTASSIHEPPDTPEKAKSNPDGWYVVAFDWKQVVEGRQAVVAKPIGVNSTSQTMVVPEACR